MFLYFWSCPGSPFFCQCLSVFLSYRQDSSMSCSLQHYLQKPKYFDLRNHTYSYILVVIKRCRFRASCPASDLKKKALFFFIHRILWSSWAYFLSYVSCTPFCEICRVVCLLRISFLLSHETNLSGCFVGLWFFFLQSVQPVNLNYDTSLNQWYSEG